MTSYKNSEPRLPIMRGSPPQLRVPFMDWDRSPWNRWSFQHVRDILPTAEVWRGPGPHSVFPQVPQDLGGIAFKRSLGSESTVEAFLDESYTDGFLVLHRGRIICERYFNGMSERTLHLSQSVAKSVTGTAAGCLAALGVLDPNALITNYLPELAATAYQGATVRTGSRHDIGRAFQRGLHRSLLGNGQGRCGIRLEAGASGGRKFSGDHVGTHPVAHHARACTWRVLRLSLDRDRRAGLLHGARQWKTPAAACLGILWRPMGAVESACFTLDRAGYALADGGLNATLRDYARFGALYLNRGALNGRQIVPEAWIKATQSGDHSLFGEPYKLTTPNGAYRNQFWIEDVSRPVIMCRGVFGQLIYIDPARDLVVVKLSSWPDFLDLELGIDTLRMIHAVIAEIS